jgi:hypothetical protein
LATYSGIPFGFLAALWVVKFDLADAFMFIAGIDVCYW